MSQRARVIQGQDRFQGHADERAAPLAPFNEDAEEAVVQGILNDPEAVGLALLERLEPDHFFVERYRLVYAAILDLYRAGTEIGYVSLLDRLKAAGALDEVGGPSAITKLIAFTPVPGWASNVRGSAAVVREKAERRAMLEHASAVARAAYDETTPVMKAWTVLGREWTGLRPFEPNQDFVLGEQSVAVYDAMIADERTNKTWYSVPWAGLLERRPVILPGEIVVLVGPEGSGKSAALYGWAEYYASEEGVRTAYVHTEMTKGDIFDRRAAAHTGVSYVHLMRKEDLSDRELEKIDLDGIEMGTWIHNLDYWHAGQVDADKLLLAMQRLVDDYGTQVFVLDYLNDVIPPSEKGRNDAAAWRDMLATLEDFANRNGAVVITAAQINAEGGAYQIGRALKQKAALYLRIETEELASAYEFHFDGQAYQYLPGEKSPEITIHIDKNRKGRGGKFPMFYVGPRFLWVDPNAPLLRRDQRGPVINRRDYDEPPDDPATLPLDLGGSRGR